MKHFNFGRKNENTQSIIKNSEFHSELQRIELHSIRVIIGTMSGG